MNKADNGFTCYFLETVTKHRCSPFSQGPGWFEEFQKACKLISNSDTIVPNYGPKPWGGIVFRPVYLYILSIQYVPGLFTACVTLLVSLLGRPFTGVMQVCILRCLQLDPMLLNKFQPTTSRNQSKTCSTNSQHAQSETKAHIINAKRRPRITIATSDV